VKAELVSHHFEYLAEEISNQSAESMAWFLLAACSKV
jgi:hypothetical protein